MAGAADTNSELNEESNVTSEDETARQASEANFITEAMRRFRVAEEADHDNRQRQLEDQVFYARGENHWPEDVRSIRTVDKRPMVSIDRLTEPVKHAVNEARTARPMIKILPVDNGADPDTARIAQGIIRHIEVQSDADVAYETAVEKAAIIGRGYIRVLRRYVDQARGFEQELIIDRVTNPFAVYLDPMARRIDGGDAGWCFIIEDLDRQDHNDRYPHKPVASLSAMSSIGDQTPTWMTRDTVRVAEYYYFVNEVITMVAVDDGSGKPQFMPLEDYDQGGGDPEAILRRGPMIKKVLHRAVFNAMGVLEGNADLTGGGREPGQYIPIVPVVGDERAVDAKGTIEQNGIVRPAMDAQRVYDYAVSNMVEVSMLAPKNAYVGTVGQFETDKHRWDTAHRRNYAYLQADPVEVGNGQLAPLPQRSNAEPPISASVQMVVQADSDLKSTTRRHEASLGQSGPQESGAALRTRQQQDALSNSHFLDHLRMSIRQVGRVILSQIPEVLDSARIVRIIGEDDSTSAVQVQPGFAQLSGPQQQAMQRQLPPGVEQMFDLGTSRYDVVADAGPGYATRRAEAAAEMTELIKAVPDTWPIIGHLAVKAMDWPQAQLISDLLKAAAIRNGVLPAEEFDPNTLPPEVVAALTQLQQQVQELTQRAEVAEMAQQTDEAKQGAKREETASTERVGMAKIHAGLVSAAAKNQHQMDLVGMRGQIEQVLKLFDAVIKEETDVRVASRERAKDLRTAALTPPPAPAAPRKQLTS